MKTNRPLKSIGLNFLLNVVVLCILLRLFSSNLSAYLIFFLPLTLFLALAFQVKARLSFGISFSIVLILELLFLYHELPPFKLYIVMALYFLSTLFESQIERYLDKESPFSDLMPLVVLIFAKIVNQSTPLIFATLVAYAFSCITSSLLKILTVPLKSNLEEKSHD